MSLHAFGAHSGRNAKAHELRTDERKVHQDLPSTADHKVCLERIRDLREENELLRKSADEFAALAERLQRALGANVHGADAPGRSGAQRATATAITS